MAEPGAPPPASASLSADVASDRATSLMARLRAATRAPHEALHEAPGLAPLRGAGLTPPVYRRILERFDAFLAAAEARVLEPADPWFARHGFTRLSRRPDLARDLAALEAAGVPGLTPPPSPPTLDLPSGHGAALGVLYVIEGSRLGGRGLARTVAGMLPPDVAGATRFLGSPDLDVSVHWRHLETMVNEQGEDIARAEAALDAASRTFADLGDWFGEVP